MTLAELPSGSRKNMTSAARPQPRFLRARAWRRARIQQLAGFNGLLQVDGYAAYSRALADPARAGGPVTLAYCWSHVRRRFYEIAQGCNAPLAEDALQRIAALYRIEDTIRGHAPEQRHTLRRDQSRPIVDGLRVWLDAQLVTVPGGSRIAEAIRYALKLWSGLRLFLDDGRIEIDTNVVERAIRPIALNRKKRAVRRLRPGRRPLGHHRLADRDRKAQRRRSPGLPGLPGSSTATPPARSTSSCPGLTSTTWSDHSAYSAPVDVEEAFRPQKGARRPADVARW